MRNDEETAAFAAGPRPFCRIEVRDNGTGGADPQSHGLVGMSDRAAAPGGRLEIDRPPGAGTCVVATLPI